MANISELTIFEPLDSFTEEERKSWSEDESFYVSYLKREEKVYVALQRIPVEPCLRILSLANQIIPDQNRHPNLRSEWETKKKKAVEELLVIQEKYPNLKLYNFFARSKVPLE